MGDNQALMKKGERHRHFLLDLAETAEQFVFGEIGSLEGPCVGRRVWVPQYRLYP